MRTATQHSVDLGRVVLLGVLLSCILVRIGSTTKCVFGGESTLDKKGIGVHGRWLTKDGDIWIARGVGLAAFTYAPWYSEPNRTDKFGFHGAAAHFGPKILNAAKTWGIDSLRIMVSQPGLDPQSDIYLKKYVEAAVSGIKLCLDEGFVVILAMQDQPHSGETDVKPLPTQETLRAWETIGPHFANHPYVMFELFNESGLVLKNRPRRNLELWMNGGSHTEADGTRRNYIGHQTMVNAFRRRGWKNVIVVDTMPWARRIDARALAIKDPLGQLAFAVHPYYLKGGATREQWDANFGNAAEDVVVLVNEWFSNSKARFSVQTYDLPQITDDFLAYLREKQIPLWAFAFDIPATIVRDYRGTPNNWTRFGRDGVTLGRGGAGCGEQVRRHFQLLMNAPPPRIERAGVSP